MIHCVRLYRIKEVLTNYLLFAKLKYMNLQLASIHVVSTDTTGKLI